MAERKSPLADVQPDVIPFEDAVAWFQQAGWYPRSSHLRALIEHLKAKPYEFNSILRAYQKSAGLKPDGWLGPATARRMLHGHRCGCPEFAANEVCKWPFTDVNVALAPDFELPNLSHREIREIIADVHAEIAAACGLSLVLVNDRAAANIVAHTGTRATHADLDGPGQTLAFAYMPCGRMTRRAVRQMVFDAEEPWNDRMFRGVWGHEELHAVGVPHTRERGNLMLATFDGTQVHLGPWDRAQLVKRYGRTAPTPVPPSEPPTAGPPPLMVVETADGWVGRVTEWSRTL